MKILLKTICENAFHTKENGNLNIIGIFENILFPNFPATHFQVTFVFILKDPQKEKEFDYYADISDSSGKKIFDNSSKPSKGIIGKNGMAHLIINLRMLSFPHEGKYTANFYFGKDKVKESIGFDVKQKV